VSQREDARTKSQRKETTMIDDDSKPSRSPKKAVANNADDLKGILKRVGRSKSDNWNHILANQAMNTLWLARSDDQPRDSQDRATLSALVASSRTTSSVEAGPVKNGAFDEP
jgi:hypothetical protein